MASITKLSNSNYVSSLYNSSNIISGLASGMDTEGMIENLTKSYQTKITQLQQKSTKIGWKQDAYRSIISKMYSFSNKYTSYTSSTNLLSQSFFNAARTSTVDGKYANKVSASGTTSSDIVLNSVDQLATSARYVTKGNFASGQGTDILASEGIDLTGTTDVNALQGSISLTYGNTNVSVLFSETDTIKAQKKDDGTLESDTEALARTINEKLEKETIQIGNSSVAANERIKAVAKSDGTIEFQPVNTNANGEDKAGNSIYISSGSGAFKNIVPDDASADDKKKIKSFDVPKSYDYGIAKDDDDNPTAYFRKEVSNIEKISGKTMNINLDGTTKQVTMPTISEQADGKYTIGDKKDIDKDNLATEYTAALQEAVKDKFGGKITVTNNSTDATKLQLKFDVADGSDLLINTDAGNALGIGKVASNYLTTGKSLKELGISFDGLEQSKDKDGNVIEGKYDFVINGKTIGSYGEDTSLSTILSDINSKSDVKVSYSKTSREFVFTDKDTGSETKVDISGGLAKAMFGKTADSPNYTAGQDAKFSVTVNGQEKTLTRSSNKVEIDGLTINFKGTFKTGPDDDPVTFQNSINADNVVDGVKNMIAELNVMLSEVRSQYSTMPAKNSSGALKTYEPLTDEDMASMSESAIKNYEEKAKQGLLFADSNLSGLYNGLVSIFNRSGEDATMLKNMGIGISYDTNGAATITLDENKLRTAMEDDFDGVVDMFTRSKENGAGTDGIMQSIKGQMDKYGATTGAVKGILVQQAGTPLASLSLLDNAWQKEIDNYSSQIEKWGDKLKKQVDKYTSMFSRMEVLINQMNQQSSQLASMMGG